MKKSALLTAIALLLCVTGACIPVNPDRPVAATEPEQSNTNLQTIPADAKLVCLFFDDGWQNQYDVALPVLLQHDFKATFGIITDHIGTGHDIWEYIDVEEIRTLAKHGMDIGGHTKTHSHLTHGLSDQQLMEEIIGSRAHLEKLGFHVRTFVYPFCEWDKRIIGYVKLAGYTCARSCRWDEDFYNLNTADADARFHVASRSIVQHNFDQFKSVVDKAGHENVVCLTYHFISDTGPESTSTPVSNFVEQIRYLKENGFIVALLPDLIE
jgi:peptidoglycan/xylan/chitin deacetylase (PgdA/CDA1 family)